MENNINLQELIDKKPPKVIVKDAAAIMGVSPRFLQVGLQQGKFLFGTAVKMGKWAYYINTERFIKYMMGL